MKMTATGPLDISKTNTAVTPRCVHKGVYKGAKLRAIERIVVVF